MVGFIQRAPCNSSNKLSDCFIVIFSWVKWNLWKKVPKSALYSRSRPEKGWYVRTFNKYKLYIHFKSHSPSDSITWTLAFNNIVFQIRRITIALLCSLSILRLTIDIQSFPCYLKFSWWNFMTFCRFMRSLQIKSIIEENIYLFKIVNIVFIMWRNKLVWNMKHLLICEV